MKASVWIETGPAQPAFPEVDGGVEADVAVIGAGIVGITTALLLTEAGVRVAVLEADRLVQGVTGHTTAKVTSHLLQGRESPASPFDSNRLTLRASAPRLVTENLHAGLRFVGDRLTKPGRRSAEDLRPGEGPIARLNEERVAAYRHEDGTLHAVSPNCTHLGCQVNFNAAARTRDCSCHGSRFAPDGSVLQGPAVHRLERNPVD